MLSRFIKLAISLIVAGGDALLRCISGRRTPGSCVVLNYHSVSDDGRSRFAKQLDILMRLAQPIRASQPAILEREVRYVVITADDAFCSLLQNAMPELCQRNIPVTLFVPTGYFGMNSSWADYGGENKVGEKVASVEDLKRIAGFKNIEFGSHCVSHPDLALLTEEQVRQELEDSKKTLETLLGTEVVSLSFPYGSYGPRELRLAQEAGYKFCFSSTPQTLFSCMQGGLIGRVDVQPTDWNIEFRLKILGAYRWINRASAWKRKCRSCLNPSPQTEVPIHG